MLKGKITEHEELKTETRNTSKKWSFHRQHVRNITGNFYKRHVQYISMFQELKPENVYTFSVLLLTQLLMNRQTREGGSHRSEACAQPAEALHVQGFDHKPSLTS